MFSENRAGLSGDRQLFGEKMKLAGFKTVFFLNPHADDSEISSGGTIVNLIRSGSRVYYICFSIPIHPEEDKCRETEVLKEIRNAVSRLGIKKENLIFLNFPIRRFNEKRQEILDELIKLKKKFKPDLVFCHSSSDVHQDHKIIHEETLRAFKDCSILGYESHWNQLLGQDNRIFAPVSEEVFRIKLKALKEYKTQKNRGFFSEEIHRSIMTYHGFQIKEKYAECFECIRLVL